jgi:hypothetical protein
VAFRVLPTQEADVYGHGIKVIHSTSLSLLRVCLALMFAALSIPASAQVNLIGEWAGRYHEDQIDRVPGPDWGDYLGLPINESARMYADTWDISRGSLLEHQCQPYSVPHIYRGPLQFRLWEEKHPDTQEVIAIKQFIGTYMQWRTIWMDGRPHPPEYAPHTFMGFSTGEWHGDVLVVSTTHIKAEYFRRTGIPSSDRTTLMEYYMRHGTLMTHVTVATDPVYLSEPLIMSQEFVLMDRPNQNWLYNCDYVLEIARPKNEVPHFLPGANPFLSDTARNYALPLEPTRGGAETMYPEYMTKLKTMTPVTAK